jgi:hypothetical protein
MLVSIWIPAPPSGHIGIKRILGHLEARLTENANEPADHLTQQVRATAEVTSGVAEADPTAPSPWTPPER